MSGYEDELAYDGSYKSETWLDELLDAMRDD